MGPVIVTADAITDVSRLRVQTWVNNDLRQDDVVASLIFDIPTLIETLSRTMTLEPGDIIATGTPAGVGMGFYAGDSRLDNFDVFYSSDSTNDHHMNEMG